MKNLVRLPPRYGIKHISEKKLMAANPTLIGEVGGYRFYEHPTLGDESPLIVVGFSICEVSPWWELPTYDEMREE